MPIRKIVFLLQKYRKSLWGFKFIVLSQNQIRLNSGEYIACFLKKYMFFFILFYFQLHAQCFITLWFFLSWMSILIAKPFRNSEIKAGILKCFYIKSNTVSVSIPLLLQFQIFFQNQRHCLKLL